jgi:hypothetical protein
VPAGLLEEQKKGVAQAAGFSLHAGIGIEAEQRGKLERLCRERCFGRYFWTCDRAAREPDPAPLSNVLPIRR